MNGYWWEWLLIILTVLFYIGYIIWAYFHDINVMKGYCTDEIKADMKRIAKRDLKIYLEMRK